MTIWVDADACPGPIREILFKAARRTGIQLNLVANQFIRTPASANIKSIQVESGFDVADDYITNAVDADDLVITADIPLASDVMEKGAIALNPRGELYSADTIRQKLNMRDFMDVMRGSGVHTGGPPPMGSKERMRFANHLDQYLAKSTKRVDGKTPDNSK